MATHPTFCCNCGTAYDSSLCWPKICKSCRHEVYGNPIPVVVVLCPLDDRMLLVQRNIPPGVGLWVNAGGFQNHGETPEEAARRELREETEHRDETGQLLEPGLDIAIEAFAHVRNIGLSDLNLVLMFYRPADVEELIRRWWYAVGSRAEASTFWNEEVRTLTLASKEETTTLKIAFSTHAEALLQWFERR